CGAGLAAMDDVDGQRHRRVIGENADGKIDCPPRSRRNLKCPERKWYGAHPVPLVWVRKGRAFFSRKVTIAVATSTPVAVSMPSRPGEELTSITSGPRLERSMSTPHTLRPIERAALSAVARSADVIFTACASPPRWRLERKSPFAPERSIAATA